MKKTMASFGWTTNILILIGLLSVIMLIILLVAAIQLKPYTGNDTLNYFSRDFLENAAHYNKTVLLLSIAERFITWAMMAGILFIFWKNFYFNNRIPILLAAGIFALFSVVIFLIVLPLQYYRSFVIDHSFGLSNQTLASWFMDVLKDRAITLVINTAALTLLYTLIIYMPGNWWLVASAVFIIFLIIVVFIYPILIDPLFYNFSPLEDKELQKSMIKMTDDAGIEVEKILIADASTKTNRVNAYFTGLGNTKRIVIYDNLLNNYSKEETLSVIAHEIGHWKYRHIFLSIIMGAAGIFMIMFILKLIQANINLNTSVKLVIILFIVFSLLNYLSMPLQNFVSRQFEKQADRTVFELTGDRDTQVEILGNLARSNLSNVDPGPVLKYILYTHPPTMDRIRSLNN
jgi:STE24 endopeptidase